MNITKEYQTYLMEALSFLLSKDRTMKIQVLAADIGPYGMAVLEKMMRDLKATDPKD